jgi:hypothetical protein
MKLTSIFTLAGVLALGAQATAQNFNIDIDGTFGTPSNALAGAASQAGTWNLVPATSAGTPLVDINGAASSVTIARTSGTGGAYSFNNAATSGDDQALLDDAQDPGAGGTWTISGLAAGSYDIIVYGWAPDSDLFRTGVSVNGGPVTPVGGTFTGTYTQGVTHSLDTVTIATGGTVVITLSVVTSFGTFNGVQVKSNTPVSAFTPFCSGDGTGTACPCANNGIPGNGCAHSLSTAGANLAGTGNTSISNDTASLNGTNMPNSSALYFQGTIQQGGGAGATFGDGKRCAGGVVTRLGTKTNVAGASSYPVGADLPLHIKGGVAAGDTRTYQVWYRNADPAFCTPSTFNLSNGVSATWTP